MWKRGKQKKVEEEVSNLTKKQKKHLKEFGEQHPFYDKVSQKGETTQVVQLPESSEDESHSESEADSEPETIPVYHQLLATLKHVSDEEEEDDDDEEEDEEEGKGEEAALEEASAKEEDSGEEEEEESAGEMFSGEEDSDAETAWAEMVKIMYTAEDPYTILLNSSSEWEESSDDFLPVEDSYTESDSSSEFFGPPPARPIRREVQAGATGPAVSTDIDSEGEGPPLHGEGRTVGSAATSSDGSRRAGRRRRNKPPTVPQDLIQSPSTMEVPNVPASTARRGILVATENMQPLNFLELFLTETFLQYITEQTNIYAEQYKAANPSSSFKSKWNPTNPSEIRVFLGLTFSMAINEKPLLRHYWSNELIHHMPMYSAAMPRQRYEMLLSCLSFNNPADNLPREDPAYDRLFKLRPLINHLNEKFGEIYVPESEIVLDESLVPFPGMPSKKQYIPSKRTRYGLKVYKMCESETGYTCSFKIHDGKVVKVASADYKKYRLAIDLADPMPAPYEIAQKKEAWCKNVAFYLMKLSLQNAYVIFKKAGNRGRYETFQDEVCTSLIFESGQPAMNMDPFPSEDFIRLHGRHFATLLPASETKKCIVCLKHSIKKDTRYDCPKCPSQPGLCPIMCFEAYHTLSDY